MMGAHSAARSSETAKRGACQCLPNMKGFAAHLLVLDLLVGFGIAP